MMAWQQRSGLYRLDAFGLSAEWNLWRLKRDALDEPELESAAQRRRLYADDFGDADSLRIARQAFPGLHILPYRRSERFA